MSNEEREFVWHARNSAKQRKPVRAAITCCAFGVLAGYYLGQKSVNEVAPLKIHMSEVGVARPSQAVSPETPLTVHGASEDLPLLHPTSRNAPAEAPKRERSSKARGGSLQRTKHFSSRSTQDYPSLRRAFLDQ